MKNVNTFYWPEDHHIWTYCIHLGPWTCPNGGRYDLGVYVESGNIVSRACVYGPEPHDYISAEIIWDGEATRGTLARVSNGATDFVTLMDIELFERLGHLNLLSDAIKQSKRKAWLTRLGLTSERDTPTEAIEVYGKRWRDSHGNTYHTTHIRVDGKPMYTSPITYGYGDHYYHSTAIEWLASNGYITSEGYGRRLREARDVLNIQYEVVDVKRRRDLGGEWLQTQDARNQLRKNPRNRICPNCGLTCIDMYRFAVPCNPELARGGE